MKLTSRILPHSRTVGGGLMLVDESGREMFQVAFIGRSHGISEEQTEALARQFDRFVREHGLQLPPAGTGPGDP